MDAEQSRAAICHYLQQQHVLTLCAGETGDLWCASCFYLFDPEHMACYLMTEAETRHGQLMQCNPLVAGTIAGQPEQVAELTGIQYRGEIRLLSGELAQIASQRYVQRFPVAQQVSAPIWQLSLLEIKMTDNRLGFGTKLHWQR